MTSQFFRQSSQPLTLTSPAAALRSRMGRRGIVGAAVLAFLVGMPAATTAQTIPSETQQECRIPQFPAPLLCARAGLDTVPASYLFVVDESGSMKPLWDGVRAALATFAQAVPDGSELDVRLFAGTAHQKIPATVSSPAARRNWAHELGSMPTPRGAHTDLGRAAKAAIDKLRAAPSDRLQFVFFLTDGQQDPALGSPYAATWNADWDALAREAQSVTMSRPVRVGIIRLTPSADQQFLQRIFPNALSTDAMTPAALHGWFQNQMAEAAVEKLRLLVSHDLNQGARLDSVAVRTYAGRPREVMLPLRSDRRLVSSFISAGTTLELPGGGSLRARSDVTIEPGETKDVQFTLVDANYPVYLPPGRRTRNIDQQLVFNARPGPTGEFSLIGADTTTQGTTLLPKLTIVGGGALPWPLYVPVVLLITAVVGAGVVGAKWKMHRAFLPGRLIIRPTQTEFTDRMEEKTERLKDKRLRQYTVTHSGDKQILTLEARSERGKTVVYAIPHTDVTIRGKRLSAPQAVRSATTFDSPLGQITYFPN
jgi:hypothetical protein